MLLSSKAVVYGDDINTDLIIAGKYTKTLNTAELAEHAMEDLDPDFLKKCADGAFLVAGEYFGCGSSREQAPVALLEAGVKCVAAKSFSRIFFRNAINIGLPIVACDTSQISEGDVLEYELGGGELRNLTKNLSLPIMPLPALMVHILDCGGVVQAMRKYGSFDTILKEKSLGFHLEKVPADAGSANA